MQTPDFTATRSQTRRVPALALLLLAALLPLGCRVVQHTAELPGKTVGFVVNSGNPKPSTIDPVEVQQRVLRFANEFSTAATVCVDKLRRGTNVLDPAEALQWKLALDSATCSIASGPNAYADLLDLTFFVTVTRSVVEDHWQPRDFGDSAQPLLESCRSSETNLWQFIGKVLTPAQQRELRNAIQQWRVQNPHPESVVAARAVGLASFVADTTHSDPAKPGSVFNLLMLDPLAGMDPAVREIAQTRMFAERSLYVAQKMPRIVRWQTELLSLNTVRMPAVQQVVSNSTQITASVETFAKMADQLPQVIDAQREAALRQVFEGLAVERTNLIASLAADDLKLRATLAELRQTIDSGNELMKSSDTTIRSLDTFMVRFDTGTNAPAAPATNARPFDILDYAATAKEATTTLRELNATINSLDKAVPRIQELSQAFERSGNRMLNRMFLIGAGLVVLFLVGAFIAAMVYRRSVRQG